MTVDFDIVNATDLARDAGGVRYEKTFTTSNPLPTSCPAVLTPTGALFEDDFNRADADTLGPNYVEFGNIVNPVQNDSWLGIRTNQCRKFNDPPIPPPNTGGISPFPKAGIYTPFPSTGKDQYCEVTLGSVILDPTGGAMVLNPGAQLRILTRCNQPDAANFWYEAGAGGGGTQSGLICYMLQYSVVFNFAGGFQSALLNISRNELLGVAGIATAAVAELQPGDVLRFTAANFFQFGQENVCLKGFVNGVLRVSGNDFSGPIPGIQAGRQLTGGVGLMGGGFQDPALTTFNVGFLFDDFRSQVCDPNPF